MTTQFDIQARCSLEAVSSTSAGALPAMRAARGRLASGAVLIAITGDPYFDERQARRIWAAKHDGARLAENHVLRHDGRVVELVTPQAKHLVIGRMEAVSNDTDGPSTWNALPRESRRYTADRELAVQINQLALEGRGPIEALGRRFESLSRIQSGKACRMVPVGCGMAIIDFTDHPPPQHEQPSAFPVRLLLDIVNAYDAGFEFTDKFDERDDELVGKTSPDAGKRERWAHRAARKEAVQAFNEVAQVLEVTNAPARPDKLVVGVLEPMSQFYFKMYLAHFRASHGNDTEYPAEATVAERSGADLVGAQRQVAKEELERSLRRELQPAPSGPKT